MAFCGNCGKPVDDDTVFCPHCGARVAEDIQAGGTEPYTPSTPEPEYPEPAPRQSQPKSPGKTGKSGPPMWLILLGVFFLAVVIGAGGWLVFGRRDAKPEKKVSSEEKKESENTEEQEAGDEPAIDWDDSDSDDEEPDDQWNDESEEPVSENWEDAEYIIPDSLSRRLSDAEIAELARDNKKLNYAKNEIYARYGYIFKKQELYDHFCTKSWYSPEYTDQEDAAAFFTPAAKSNAERMGAYENRSGYTKYEPR